MNGASIASALPNGEHITAQYGWTGDNGDPDNFFFLRGCPDGKPAATTPPNGATPNSTTCWSRRA